MLLELQTEVSPVDAEVGPWVLGQPRCIRDSGSGLGARTRDNEWGWRRKQRVTNGGARQRDGAADVNRRQWW